MNAQPMEGDESLSKAGSYRLLDFEWATLLRARGIGSAPGITLWNGGKDLG